MHENLFFSDIPKGKDRLRHVRNCPFWQSLLHWAGLPALYHTDQERTNEQPARTSDEGRFVVAQGSAQAWHFDELMWTSMMKTTALQPTI
jgi:hypothetical protein